MFYSNEHYMSISHIPLIANMVHYVFRTSIDFMKETDFTLERSRSRRYPAQTITDAESAGDIAFLANTPAQAESLLHSLERVADGIGLHVNADKTESMWRHLYTKWWFSDTSGQIHLPREQRTVYQKKWHQYVTSEGIVSYR